MEERNMIDMKFVDFNKRLELLKKQFSIKRTSYDFDANKYEMTFKEFIKMYKIKSANLYSNVVLQQYNDWLIREATEEINK